ncbi:hypothetical protein OIU80_02260 [Flavobacterium sp. LS1R47]|uniref:Uncharacterized protein n=1 Tax=Flavobacterium frigoritolerans TaxID=2987686 RepID=A0A9X3C8F3_9FLAO|nr:hypothetical protein [Flavobacterium frigoritolerans]MCV9931093.1 hypothetical protein [Flavobacterium frigoritolerans]
MCRIDWDLLLKFTIPILAFFAGWLPIFFADKRRTKELKSELKLSNEFKEIELNYKRAEFIYNQKHQGYENLLKIISNYSKDTRDLIFEDFLLVVFEFNSKNDELNNNEIESFYEKFSSISKKYNDLYQLLNIEIQPSILNSSDEVYDLIEDVKSNYNTIFKKFTDDFLPKFMTFSIEEMEKHNYEIKTFFKKYQLSFDQLKMQMRKEIKEEQTKINKLH